jgi:hypothetical protein
LVSGLRDAEIADVPFLAVLAGCSARRPERSVASHISEGQRSNAPVSAAKKGISVVSASLMYRAQTKYSTRRANRTGGNMNAATLDPRTSEFETEEQASSYDHWFRVKIQEAIDDKRTDST